MQTSPSTDAREELRTILTPLVAAAVQTSTAAYQWGLQHKQLMRAGALMDVCGELVQELNATLRRMGAEDATRRSRD